MDGNNCGGGNDDADDGSYSIVVIDLPLSRDLHVSCMDMEPVGIYPNDKNGGEGGVIPKMVMVFQCFKRNSNDGNGISGYQTSVTMLMNSVVGGNTRCYDCVIIVMLMVDCCVGVGWLRC